MVALDAMTMNCDIDARIEAYLAQIESGSPRACKDQIALAKHIRRCFATEPIYTDTALLDKYLRLQKYFPFQLFPWEIFLLALWDCTFWRASGLPRWKTLFCMIGRGAGKDGFIAFDGFCSISPYNPIRRYNVDVCANNEEQSKRPQLDLVDVLETPRLQTKLDRHYYHTKEVVQGRKNKGVMKGHTNSPKGRDGLRSGKVILNEVHQYENYDNITVFTTGLGKVDHPRIGIFSSNGDVSDGPLDDYLEQAQCILFGGEDDSGFLPFVCRLDDKDEVHDPENWYKANPSLQYRPSLATEIADEYRSWTEHPERNASFLTKRMGLRAGQTDITVTDYAKIKATNKPLPDLSGWSCTVGLDYAELNDWAAVNLHFRQGDERYDINHAWICLQSKTLHRVKAPWKAWASDNLVTPVDDVSLHPSLIADYIQEAISKYDVKMLAMDNFRWPLVAQEMQKLGFNPKDKTKLKLIRPADIMQVDPVIQNCFDRELFTWGNNPCLRWAVNNTKRVRSSRKIGSDTGNFYYAKIEAKSRKTDPFMALVASMVVEPVLEIATLEAPPVSAIVL